MHENEVVVPDVVGMTFEDALRVAVEEGVSLANPDPDGPPIGAIAWRQNARVLKQHPEAGVRADRNDSVTVYLDGGDGTFAVVHAEPPQNRPPAQAILEGVEPPAGPPDAAY